jgi:queuine/archaeosine tRNA-ribosyltransferase
MHASASRTRTTTTARSVRPLNDLCVVYLSDDEPVVRTLVGLLRKKNSAWWADDIPHGDWESRVRAEIARSRALLAVLSPAATGGRVAILRDEIRFALRMDLPVLLFLIGEVEVPFGLGGIDRVDAFGWTGDPQDARYLRLAKKIAATLDVTPTPVGLRRARALQVGRKTLALPDFVFSVSSHETQIRPSKGVQLLTLLSPSAVLVSAYDLWNSKKDSGLLTGFSRLRASDTLSILDSGNYEAARRDDYRDRRRNPKGWHVSAFRDTAISTSPDLAFSFDVAADAAQVKGAAKRIIRRFEADDKALGSRNFPLCPIVHIPDVPASDLGEVAATLLARIARELRPSLIAVPERELGDGLAQRMRVVRRIRKELNKLDSYVPLHLLGTGNPTSMVVLAASGADMFDGLEWCRTVADYQSGHLLHFQQLEVVAPSCLSRVTNRAAREILEDPDATYASRALAYNIDFFTDWTKTMRQQIQSGQPEGLRRMASLAGPLMPAEVDK